MKISKKQGITMTAALALSAVLTVPALAASGAASTAPSSPDMETAVCKSVTVSVSAAEKGKPGNGRLENGVLENGEFTGEITLKDGTKGQITVNERKGPFTVKAGENGEYIVSIDYK